MAERLLLKTSQVYEQIFDRALAGVRFATEDMQAHVLDLVPVRKVYRTGPHINQRRNSSKAGQGRQDVRTLSLEEALSESLVRRRLGLPSPFPTDASGRRLRNSQSLVRTAQLTDTYRARNRANRGSGDESRDIFRVNGQNRLGRIVETEIGISRVFVDEEAEANLSARGRAELRRATGPTLGGALKRSVDLHEPSVTRAVITQVITAGDDEVDYAKYVEFGTRRSRAQPFMRPALAQARGQYPETLKQHLLGVVGKGRR